MLAYPCLSCTFLPIQWDKKRRKKWNTLLFQYSRPIHFDVSLFNSYNSYLIWYNNYNSYLTDTNLVGKYLQANSWIHLFWLVQLCERVQKSTHPFAFTWSNYKFCTTGLSLSNSFSFMSHLPINTFQFSWIHQLWIPVVTSTLRVNYCPSFLLDHSRKKTLPWSSKIIHMFTLLPSALLYFRWTVLHWGNANLPYSSVSQSCQL